MADEWDNLRVQVKDILESKHIQDIELIQAKVESLQVNIVSFFEEKVSDLPLSEKKRIKSQGEDIMKDLGEIMIFLKDQRKKQSSEAYKMSQGKKAVSAYKNT